MLVTLNETKAYLGITLTMTEFDSFLTQQVTLLSNAIEGYCGRKFGLATYIQTFYEDEMDIDSKHPTKLPLYHYPITTITSVLEGTAPETTANTTYRLHRPSATLTNTTGWFNGGNVQVTYEAGYASIPEVLKQVVYSLVQQAYNKKKNGVTLDFGNDVQSISIPGVMSIAYDYSLQNNDRKSTYGMYLSGYLNVLNIYRSERRMVGSPRIKYVN